MSDKKTQIMLNDFQQEDRENSRGQMSSDGEKSVGMRQKGRYREVLCLLSIPLSRCCKPFKGQLLKPQKMSNLQRLFGDISLWMSLTAAVQWK